MSGKTEAEANPLSVFVEGHRPGRRSAGTKQGFDVADGLRRQQNVTTDGADLRGDVIDDYDPALMTDRMRDGFILVLSRTTLNAATHGLGPLWVGVTHFGGFGS